MLTWQQLWISEPIQADTTSQKLVKLLHFWTTEGRDKTPLKVQMTKREFPWTLEKETWWLISTLLGCIQVKTT